MTCDFCALIVTFNRKELLKDNLYACEKQTLKPKVIILVDNNSTDGTTEFVEELSSHFSIEIKYLKLEKNYGSSGGFYFGIKKAFDCGYKWILTMDDDGKPGNPETFNILYKAALLEYSKNKLVAIGPWVTYDGNNSSFSPSYSKKEVDNAVSSNEIVLRDSLSPYNGTMFSRELIETIGFPNKDYFITGDEVDYYFRCLNVGASIKTVLNSIYIHPKAKYFSNKFLSKSILSYENFSETKQYFYFRNRYLNYLIHNKKKLAKRFRMNRILSILFFESKKRKKFSIYRTARRDAIKAFHDMKSLSGLNDAFVSKLLKNNV